MVKDDDSELPAVEDGSGEYSPDDVILDSKDSIIIRSTVLDQCLL